MSDYSQIKLDDEMRHSYIEYAMSVIVGRALPDVRDGLKPVHRRVLYSMHELNNGYNKAYKKSARIVGDVIGKYHPHGDTAVYDTIVRLAQPFSMRYPLVDGQGNFGSIDGDSPAAMRYTEVRMSRLSHELLSDIDKNTVDFNPNYDGSEREPTVLPTRLPNLLINGASGIAVGMATNIPPHNLNEVIDGVITLIKEPSLSDEANLGQFITKSGFNGPDFPTGAEIKDNGGIQQFIKTGRGSFKIRATHSIEEHKDKSSIVINELPYQVNKAKLIESIAMLVRDKKITGISHLRDESDRDGLRVVIELKKGEQPDVILSSLYKQTNLQTSFSANMVCLVDGEPCTISVPQALLEFIKHRREIITRRTLYLLKKTYDKAHILEGLSIALNNIDEMIDLIKKSKSTEEAKKRIIGKSWTTSKNKWNLSKLMLECSSYMIVDSAVGLDDKKYTISNEQAQAILDMRLNKLTNLEQEVILNDYNDAIQSIKKYLKILSNPSELDNLMITELEEIKSLYGQNRRSNISDDEGLLNREDMIKKEDVIVVLTEANYVKRMPNTEFKSQKRGGRGVNAANFKEGDKAKILVCAHTHDTILCFSTKGKAFSIRVFDIPDTSRQARGKSINNILPLDNDETISALLSVKSFDEDSYLFLTTRDGMVNRLSLSSFKKVRNSGLKAILLKGDDYLFNALHTAGDDKIILSSSSGKSIMFEETQIRERSRGTQGVVGIKLNKNAKIVSSLKVDAEQLIFVTENGFGNKVSIDSYNTQNRGGQGVISIKTSERNGNVVGAVNLDNSDYIILITNKGKTIKISASDMKTINRNTQGVRLQDMSDDEMISAISSERTED
ncbi:MAG: DNA gyrase subunit A [Pseudomonadota bacterium]|nr:DNA gyrase subunit A [Pseudomonadota bacterium]